MAPEQAQTENAEERNERELVEARAPEQKASFLERALKLETSGTDVANQAANKALQKGLDNAKLALLPLFYFYLPLVAIFIIVMIELMLHTVRESWQLPLWRKVVYILYIMLFLFLTMTILGAIGYLYAHPKEFCELALGGSWTAAPTCTVFGGFFDLLKPG